MATRTIANGGGNWTANGTWVEGTAPTNADDVVATGTSGNVTVDAGAVCRSADFTNYVGILTHTAAVTLNIGDGTAGAGNIALKLVAGMTYTLGSTATSAITFVSTNGTQQTVDTGGKNVGNFTFNGAGGSWILSSNVTTAQNSATSVTLTAGSLDLNGKVLTTGLHSFTGTATRSLTWGSATLNLSTNGGTMINATVTTGLTFDAGTSVVTANAPNAAFAGGGLTYNDVTIISGGTTQLSGANTFSNLTVSGTSNSRLSASSDQIITGLLTLTGTSSTNMGMMISSIPGTSRTYTAATVSISNMHIADMNGAGAAAPFATTNAGDVGGNTNITFPAAVIRYWVAFSGGSFAATSSWSASDGGASGASIPLPHDTANFTSLSITSTGKTITINQQAVPALDFSNVSNSPTIAHTITNGQIFVVGSVDYTGALTISGTTNYVLYGRGSHTITSAGLDMTASSSFSIQSGGGSYTLNDDLSIPSTTATFSVTVGAFDANNFNVTTGLFNSNNSNIRTVTMGNGTWTILGSNGTIWTTATSTNLTLNAGASIIDCTYSGSVGTRTFNMGNAAVNTVKVSAGSDIFSPSSWASGDVDFTGFTGSLSNSAMTSIGGSMTFGAGMTLAGGSAILTFTATTGTKTITTNSVVINNPLTFNGVGGTWQFGDTFVGGSLRTVTLTNGTLNANNQNVTFGLFSSSNANVRAITMGNGTWTLSGVGTVWTTSTATNLTFSGASATIAITDTSTSSKTLAFASSKTYGNITITPGGTGAVIWQGGSNTFNNLLVTAGPKTITFTANNTYTILGTWTTDGTSGNLITMQSSVPGTKFFFSRPSGVVTANYVNLIDSQAGGGANYYAVNSTDGGGNRGWQFFANPASATATNFFFSK